MVGVDAQISQVSSPFSFTHYGMLNGLASNEINSFAQDRTGYLWVASNNGLQRFDGVQFKTFRFQQNHPTGLPSNVLAQVHVDKDDNLWVLGAYGDIGLFDKSTFAYKSVPVKPRVPTALAASEKSFITDEYGNLFLLMRGIELMAYDKKRGEFSSEANFIPFLPEWMGITSMSQQPGTQKYWLGLQGGGIAIYNHKTQNLSYYGHNIEKEQAIDIFGNKISFAHSMFDKQGRLWFENWSSGGFPYVMQYDARRKEKPVLQFEFISTLKTYHEVHGFLQQSDGRIWLKGYQLFAFYNEEEEKFEVIPSDYRNEQGIQYQHVLNMYEDREKNIWVATRHNGMYRFNPSLQYFLNIAHQHPINNRPGEGSIMSFMETRNGDLLTGAWGDGLYRYNHKLKNIPVGIKDPSIHKYPSIWSMSASADSNTIWMACQPGLYLYDQSKNVMHFRNPPALQSRTVRQVVEDKQGNLWLGMHGTGVYRWFQPKNLKRDSIVKVEEAGNSMVNKIIVDNKGMVWVATGSHGLFLFDGKTGKQIRRWSSKGKGADTLLGDAVTGVSEYNDSLIFVTTGSELFFYHRNRQEITEVPLSESLMGSIASHQKDNSGYIWIGTTNALYRYYPFTKSMVMFDRLDGINNDRFVLSASYKMKDGRLLFGNDNAFIIFDPAAIKLSGRHIPIVFTSLEIGKREIRIDSVLKLDRLELGPDDNSVTVEFSTLTFANHPVVQYKLDKMDDEWHTADENNRATFPFLPSGSYTIRLRTINADGIPSPNHTTLSIFIRSPFWQTWWFYTLLGLMVAFVLFWFDRQRSKRKEALQKVRTDIADGLHQEVNTALSNINILSEIARLKSDKEPQKAKDYLEQIHTKSHNMIIALDDMLWSLNPANDAMDKTIQRVKEFADALTQRHGVVIELLIDKKIEKLELDMKLRHEAFLLFKEGLRSLVTAGTKLCVVHLTAERAKLLFTIEFENEGCDIQQLNNLLHRRDMEARLQALKAKLNVQVHKSRSVFMIQLPLN